MPGPISRRTNYPMDMAIANIARNAPPPGQHSWSNNAQQRAFNIAMAIVYRANASPHHRRQANGILRTLARNYGRTWNFWPRPANYMNNSNSSSNSNNRQSTSQSPNYSKASTAVKKWLSTRPHTVHMNVVNIKLPANAMDPVSHHNFKPGNEAVMVLKKRVAANGAVRSKRTFYQKNMIERLAGGKKWRTILRMKGSEPVFKDPLNRRTVYRRDLMNVKFSSN
jgi:hypothetical protein